MKWIVCVGAKAGMLFHNRRVSRDEEVCKDILKHLQKQQKLWMHPYSAKLFAFSGDKRIVAAEDFMQRASEEDCCFIEQAANVKDFQGVDEIIVYRWNRHYPWDVKFDEVKCKEMFHLVSSTEFAGKSHKKITKEVYKR